MARRRSTCERHTTGERQAAEDARRAYDARSQGLLTDCALKATDLALQIFGGHGYIHENGMEQFARDARITTLYEGTNGVQALDLVGRKLPEGAGRLLRRFFHPPWICSTRPTPTRAWPTRRPGADALHRLRRVTLWIGAHGNADREEAGAAATDYLRLFYLTALGVLWVRMARAALERGDDFGAAKLATARYAADAAGDLERQPFR